jgi:IS5 family transposase
VVYGDACYQGIAKRPEMAGTAAEFRVTMRPGKHRGLPDTPEGRVQDLIETALTAGFCLQ